MNWTPQSSAKRWSTEFPYAKSQIGLDVADRPAVWRVIYALEGSAAAGLLILAAAPLVAAAGVVMALSGRGPLVSHLRVGTGGRPFWMLKLRTMWSGRRRGSRWQWIERVAEDPGPAVKRPDDQRVSSRFAKFIRKYSVDELPQLIHVLSGRMSLVGPRPLTKSELDLHYGIYSKEILALKPGITGLWQVLGRTRLTYAQRRRLDLFYARKGSIRLYARILLLTIPRVVTGKDSW